MAVKSDSITSMDEFDKFIESVKTPIGVIPEKVDPRAIIYGSSARAAGLTSRKSGIDLLTYSEA